jgi:hypothetical protein
MVVGSLYGTSLTDLCLKSKHLRLRLSRQKKPAERAGRFLIVQRRVPPEPRSVNGTPVPPPAPDFAVHPPCTPDLGVAFSA